jgi:hypothetical protein
MFALKYNTNTMVNVQFSDCLKEAVMVSGKQLATPSI